MSPDDASRTVETLDDVLLRLRRLWAGPPPALVLDEGDTGPVTFSSVLVVEACSRLPGEVSVGDVAGFLGVEHSTASRFVDRAVRAGLLSRHVSASDARRVALALTARGIELRTRAHEFRTAWLARVLDTWSPDDVSAFATYLARFAGSVADHGAPAGLSSSPGIRTRPVREPS